MGFFFNSKTIKRDEREKLSVQFLFLFIYWITLHNNSTISLMILRSTLDASLEQAFFYQGVLYYTQNSEPAKKAHLNSPQSKVLSGEHGFIQYPLMQAMLSGQSSTLVHSVPSGPCFASLASLACWIASNAFIKKPASVHVAIKTWWNGLEKQIWLICLNKNIINWWL